MRPADLSLTLVAIRKLEKAVVVVSSRERKKPINKTHIKELGVGMPRKYPGLLWYGCNLNLEVSR